MNPYDEPSAEDVEYLLGEIEGPVSPETPFRSMLEQELAARLAPRRGDQPLPPGWALCPFDRFCVAQQHLPKLVRRHCPCLHAGPLLRRMAGHVEAVHARPCTGLTLRNAAAGGSG